MSKILKKIFLSIGLIIVLSQSASAKYQDEGNIVILLLTNEFPLALLTSAFVPLFKDPEVEFDYWGTVKYSYLIAEVSFLTSIFIGLKYPEYAWVMTTTALLSPVVGSMIGHHLTKKPKDMSFYYLPSRDKQMFMMSYRF
mgnify:CR=1 FL=1